MEGKSVREICRSAKMPSPTAVLSWQYDDRPPGFRDQFVRAQQIGLQLRADRVLELGERPKVGIRSKEETCRTCGGLGRKDECEFCGSTGQHPERPDSWRCGKCKCRACGGSGTIGEKIKGDAVERSKLAVATNQWYLRVMAPARFGNHPVEAAKQDGLISELAEAIKASPHDDPADPIQDA